MRLTAAVAMGADAGGREDGAVDGAAEGAADGAEGWRRGSWPGSWFRTLERFPKPKAGGVECCIRSAAAARQATVGSGWGKIGI